MSLKVLRLIVMAVLAVPFSWAQPDLVPAEPSAFDCSKLIEYFIGFDPKIILRISERNPISYGLVDTADMLTHGIRRLELTEDRHKACVTQALQYDVELTRYFRKRLQYLLAKNDLDRFWIEKRRLEEPVDGVEQQYFEATHRVLLGELGNTSWRSFSSLQVTFEVWNQDWERRLGRVAPAAVRLEDHAIAIHELQPPDDTKIFLFHEMAHLSDTCRGSAKDNEICAWQQTLGYLAYLKSQGRPIPIAFQSIQSNIQIVGLANWVEMVLRSREDAAHQRQ